MQKLTIWSDVHEEIAELKKLVDPKLSKAIESVALTIYCNEGLTKKEIRVKSGARKQRVSHLLKKLVQIGWLKTTGRGVRRDAKRYFVNHLHLQAGR